MEVQECFFYRKILESFKPNVFLLMKKVTNKLTETLRVEHFFEKYKKLSLTKNIFSKLFLIKGCAVFNNTTILWWFLLEQKKTYKKLHRFPLHDNWRTKWVFCWLNTFFQATQIAMIDSTTLILFNLIPILTHVWFASSDYQTYASITTLSRNLGFLMNTLIIFRILMRDKKHVVPLKISSWVIKINKIIKMYPFFNFASLQK